MKTRDYEAVASALRATLPMHYRIRVYRHLAPLLSSTNPRFNPVKFGESLKLPRLFINQMEEVESAYSNKEEVTQEERYQENHSEESKR